MDSLNPYATYFGVMGILVGGLGLAFQEAVGTNEGRPAALAAEAPATPTFDARDALTTYAFLVPPSQPFPIPAPMEPQVTGSIAPRRASSGDAPASVVREIKPGLENIRAQKSGRSAYASTRNNSARGQRYHVEREPPGRTGKTDSGFRVYGPFYDRW